MFDEKQLLVMCNIIAALESEGQVYHTRETSTGYGAFTEAYENSSIEDAITIGRYQHMGIEALKLLQLIYSKDSSMFTQDLISDMNTKDWNKYAISRNSATAQTIIKIISSPIGKESQDELVGQQMQEYAKYVEEHGVTDIQAQAICSNFIHQGGTGAFIRILAKTQKPYTLDNFYNASKSDTGNQVGAYRSRQTACYNMIKQYMQVAQSQVITYEINPGTTAETILNTMRGWIGLNQFDGSHMKIVNIYNNHRPLARNYALNSADSWCACTVSSAYIVNDAVDLIGGTECGVERFIEDCFKPKKIWIEDEHITPLPGDIICFNWGNTSSNNTGFADHIAIVEYVEGNIIHTIEGNSGGYCRRREYPIGYSEIRGFARPTYGSDASTTEVVEDLPIADSEIPRPIVADRILKKGMNGENVKTMQKMLVACEYDCGEIDGDFGEITNEQLKLYQKHHALEQDGEYGPVTKAQLEKSYENSQKKDYPKVMYTIKEPKSYMRKGASKNKAILKKLPVGTEVKALSDKINGAGNLWIKCYGGWIVKTALRY